MENSEANEDQAAEGQVLSWVYEYAVKFNYSRLITRTEHLSEVHAVKTFPTFVSFAYYLRRLNRISNFSIIENVKQMQELTEELLKLQQYQENVDICILIIKLNITSRLLLLNSQVLIPTIFQKQLPIFDWEDLRQEYNLNEKYKKRFETFISWVRANIDNCPHNNEESFQLSDLVLSDCKVYLESAQQKLTQLLQDVFPLTAIEKIFSSQDLHEHLGRQEIRVYSDLLKVIKKEISETSLNDFVEMLFEYSESNICTNSETSSLLENVPAPSYNSVTAEEDVRPLELHVDLKSENVVPVNGKYRYVKSKQWCPVLFSDPTHKEKIKRMHDDDDESSSFHPLRLKIHEERLTTEKLAVDRVAKYKKSSGSKLVEAMNQACCSLESSKEKDLEKLVRELESIVKILKLKLVDNEKHATHTSGHSTVSHHDTLTFNIVNSIKSKDSDSIFAIPGLGDASSFSNSTSDRSTISSMPTITEVNDSQVANSSERKPDVVGDIGRNTYKPNVQETRIETSALDISASDTTFYSVLDDSGSKKPEIRNKTKLTGCITLHDDIETERSRRKRKFTDSRDMNCTALPSNADETYHTAIVYCNNLQYEANIKPCYVNLKRICVTSKEILRKKKKN